MSVLQYEQINVGSKSDLLLCDRDYYGSTYVETRLKEKRLPLLNRHQFCKVKNKKEDIEIWSLFMDLQKEKQDPAVFLSLPQNLRECVRHLAITDIGRTDGSWVITDELDKIYLGGKHTMAYKAVKDFCSNKTAAGVNIKYILVRYEFLYKKYTNLESTCKRSSVLFCFECSEYIRRKRKATKNDACNFNCNKRYNIIFFN